MIFEIYGGQVARTTLAESAFPHCKALFLIEYRATTNTPTPITQKHYDWLATIKKELRPYFTGSQYVNYIDNDVPDMKTYFGESYDRLMSIKMKYDPDGMFQGTLKLPLNQEMATKPKATYVSSATRNLPWGH